jgi:Uma2 family endonuclease
VSALLHATPRPTRQHQVTAGLVVEALNRHRPRGYLAVEALGVNRPDERGRFWIPDVVVARWDAIEGSGLAVDPSDVLLVVEVSSPSTRLLDETLRAEGYRQAGIDLYWLLEPYAKIRNGFDLRASLGVAGTWLADAEASYLDAVERLTG